MQDRVQTILKLDVPLIVEIGRRRMCIDDVLALGPGAILELPKASDEPLDVLVNNKPVGKGNAVKVGENFGVRVFAVGTAEQRIAALGGGASAAPDAAARFEDEPARAGE